MNNGNHVLLVWTTKKGGKFKDHWIHYDDHEDASEKLAKLKVRPSTFVASICAVLESTDYPESSEYLK